MRLSKKIKSLTCSCVLLLICSVSSAAVLDIDPVIIKAKRDGHAPIEGIWEIRQQWDPSPDKDTRYRIGIVENTFGIKNAKYIGVVVCEKKGVVKGEVRLLLNPLKEKNHFIATFHTVKGDAKGVIVLRNPNLLDMSGMLLKGHESYPLIRASKRVQ